MLDAKISKKLFGNLSINEMALFQRNNPKDHVKGYYINSENRFNFLNKESKISPNNTKNYIEKIMAASAKIPSPDKYTGARQNFNDLTKKSLIYKFDRKTHMDIVIADAKKSPGVGRYDTEKFDEKFSKPPKGGPSDKTDKYNLFDEIKFLSK
jgi:hypothetical protein